jgi:hypothetical protein
VIERMLNKAVKRVRREGQEDGSMRAVEGGGWKKEENRQGLKLFYFLFFHIRILQSYMSPLTPNDL